MKIKEKRICGAKKRLSTEFCKAIPMANGRCRLHGGKSLKGFAHPRFKTGLHSKYMYLLPIDNKFEIKDFIQMTASILNIVTRFVDVKTADSIQKEIEHYYDQLRSSGVKI